ncbi:MAG: DNA polymerase III subunit [Thermoguttaceae bacterium]|jgi:DNA polymerase-3 subunit delta'
MTWHGIRGHDRLVEQFRRALGRGRLATSFLFTGPAGIGKRTFALKLAQAMLCQARPEESLDPCDTCPSCSLALAGTHPDVDVVSRPADKAFIPVELLLGDREHRGREGLCHRIALKPYMGGRKIALIDDADDLNAEGANCLLKILEEPPPRSVLILVGTSPARQLPTIRSRCQLVRFQPLAADVVAELLVTQGVVGDPVEASRLARHAGGSLSRAVELADPGLWTFRQLLFERLAAPALDSVGLAQAVGAFVDEAGKEAPARRARLRQVAAFAADFYRQLLHAQSGAALPDDDQDRPAPPASAPWSGDAAAALDRCLEAAAQIDRNANQATLIEAWLDDLATAGARRM